MLSTTTTGPNTTDHLIEDHRQHQTVTEDDCYNDVQVKAEPGESLNGYLGWINDRIPLGGDANPIFGKYLVIWSVEEWAPLDPPPTTYYDNQLET